MEAKFLAGFEDVIDLFHGQQAAIVADNKIGRLTLSGPDFDVLIQEQPFTETLDELTLAADLTQIGLPAIPAVFGDIGPRLATALELVRKGDAYVIHGLQKIDGRLEQLNGPHGLTIAQSDAVLTLGLDPWRLQVKNNNGDPIGRLTLPLGQGVAFELLEVTLDATGVVECHARLTAIQVELGGLKIEIAGGTLVMRGARVEARLTCGMTMPYFGAARVDLELTATGDLATAQWSIVGSTRLSNNEPWHDPSGLLSFDRMSVAVDFVRAVDGSFNPTMRIDGRVTFIKSVVPEPLGRWFEGLFEDMAVSFENISLLGSGTLPSFSFSPANPLTLKALGILDLRVPRLSFDQYGLSLQGGVVHLAFGGAALAGNVGDIRILLVDGPKLDLENATQLAIELAAPGGFKAQAKLVDTSTDLRQTLEGVGSLSSPALAPFDISFTVGRARDEANASWRPVVSIMAGQNDVNIPLFPGVVITRIELGAGINRTVTGVTGLTLAQAQQRLQQGLPDVMQQASWSDAESDLTIVARIFTEPAQTKGDKTISLYVADMALVMTSDFQFAAFGRLWLNTSRGDARSPEFQRQPSAVGLAMFDGLAPSLRMLAMTRSDGRSSLTKSVPGSQLLGIQVPRTQLAFEATPSGMALVLGPLEIGMELGPLHVSGSTLFALRSAAGKVYALSRSALTASFSASTGTVRIGPATLSGSVDVGFAATLGLLGDLRDNTLTVYGIAHAGCWVDLSLHVRIGFEIEISVGFGSITISWSEDWDFRFRLHVDLDLQVELDTNGGIGIDGRASLGVNVLGISATLALHMAHHTELVDDGRTLYGNASQEIDTLLGMA